MPIVPFQSYLRLTHTGLSASPLLINDLDTGYENQHRKSPVYVPVGGSIDIPLSSRVLFSVMQGTIAGFVQQGHLEVEYTSYARDGDNLGGAAGTGINLFPAFNVRRLGNTLSFLINAGLDTSGFIVGEQMTVTGLGGAFLGLDGTYLITGFTKGQDFAGANPLTAIVSVASVGADIPPVILAGVLLTLPDGMITHLYVSAGDAGGLGADVRTYFAGDMVLTGNLDPLKIIFSPVDMTGAAPNTLGVDITTNQLTFIDSDGGGVLLGNIAQELVVAKAGAPYTSVADAISQITDASASKPYIVKVETGVYEEQPFTIPSYVSVVGADNCTTIIVAANDSAHLITGSPRCGLENLTISGPLNAGYACINYEGIGTDPFKINNVGLVAGYYGIWAHPAASGLVVANGVCNYSQNALHTFMYASGHAIFRGSLCAYRDDTAGGNTYGYRAEGDNVQMYLDSCIYKDTAGTYGAYINGAGTLRLTNYTCAGGDNALYVGPAGASRLDVLGAVLRPNVTNHIVVTSPTAEVLFSGTAAQSKMTVAPGATFTANFADPAGGSYEGTVNIGELYLAYTTGEETPLRSYLGYSSSTGLGDGGVVTNAGGLDMDVAEGEGFISLGANNGNQRITWATQTITLSGAAQWWIVVDDTSTVQEVNVQPDPTQVIVLCGGIAQGGSAVVFCNATPVGLYQQASSLAKYANEVMGPINVSGTLATPHGVAPTLKLDVGSGVFYINNVRKVLPSGSDITFTAWYKVGTAWTAVTGQTALDNTQWNNTATGLVGLTAGWWTKHVLYVTVDGLGAAQYHIVYGQEENAAKGALVNIPTPPNWLASASQRSVALYLQQGVNDIAAGDIEDIRPRLGQNAPTTAAVTVHGDLLGLAADDHPQYQLRTEKGALSGYCGLDATLKVAAANIPFTATAGANVTAGLPSAGVGTEVARQDHVHFHGNLDSVDGSSVALHSDAVAGVKSGFMSAADKTKLDGIAGGSFGANFQQTADEATTTTTSSTYGNKVTLATGALTGTYRVGWSAEMTIASNNQRYQARLYNVTDGTELAMNEEPVQTSGVWQTLGGFVYLTLVGVSKTIAIQFASQNNSTQVSCRRARLEFYRVS